MSTAARYGRSLPILLLPVAAIAGLLAACAATQSFEPQATFVCENGQQIGVSFDGDRARLESHGEVATLAARSVASGFDYAGEGNDLRGKGPELAWTDPSGTKLSCRDAEWAMSQADRPQGQYGAVGLGGTSWQLVEFRAADGTAVVPPRVERYRATFNADGSIAMQLDCNRANGRWQAGSGSDRARSLAVSAGAMTRAFCGENALDSRIAQDMARVRYYRVLLGRLDLVLDADAGAYLWEPAPAGL